ncbi:MAG: molybdenum cofactor guanylyltransferase, partial [Tetragenococcus koreensis]|nr:molybdenum cofactor guanylyltransferase [Tetragenococcus koreensis]
MNPKDVTGVILCGGKSKRMGFDKALINFNGQYVLEETALTLKKIFPNVLLVTDHKQKFPTRLLANHVFLEDEFIQKGPLGGLVTALRHIDTPYLFLVACDIPSITVTKISQLFEYVEDEQVILFSGEKLETLFAFYHRSCLPQFEKQLATDDGKIRTAFDYLDVKKVKKKNIDIVNINYPE